MKKHLIAAAVAAAVAVPAMAQVTVSGTIDTFVGKQDDGRNTANTSLFASGTDGFATTNFAFSGSEDLGGGLKASFRLVKYFRSDNTQGNTAGAMPVDVPVTRTNITNDAFNTATVTVSGGFGAVTLGRNASNASEAFGVGRFGGNLGRVGGGQAGVARESSNSMSYTTPTINGITAELFRANEHTLGTGNNDASAFSVRYVQGPFALALGRADGNTTAANKTKLTSAGAAFNLGFAKLGLVYINQNLTAATPATEQETTQFHVEVPLGNGVRVLGTVGNQKAGAPNSGSDHFVVGVEKALSKRTWVYAAHLAVDNEAAAAFAIRGLAAGANGADPSATVIGVRHNF